MQNQITQEGFEKERAALLLRYEGFRAYYERELKPKEARWARYARIHIFTGKFTAPKQNELRFETHTFGFQETVTAQTIKNL